MQQVLYDGQAWTERRVGLLTTLWDQGKYASVIAAELGISRSAVIGKVHRLGLPGRRSGTPKGFKRSKRRRPQFTELEPDRPDNPMSLLELTDAVCHWPCSGEGLTAVFCGGDAVPGLPYCERHCQMAYRP